MPVKKLIQALAYAGLSGMLLYSLLCVFLPLYKYLWLSFAALVLFLVLAVIVYILGERSIENPRSGAFLSVVVINTFMKLIISFVFVFAYVRKYEPEDKFFIIPFLIYYLVFTIAETYFLGVQARKSSSR